MTSDTDSALLKEATPSTTDTSTHSLSSSSQPQHPSSSLTSFNPNMTTIQVTPPPSTSGNKFKLFFFKLFHKSHHGGDQQQQHLKRSTSFFDRFKKNNHSNGTTSYQTVSSKSDLSKKTLTQEENEKKTTHELSMSLNDLCDVVVEDKILNEQHQRPLNEHTTTSTTTSTTPFFQYIEFLFLFNANSNTLSVYNEDELKKMVPYHGSLDVTIPSLQQAFHLDDHGDDLSCVLSVQQKNMCYVFTGSHDNTILQYEYQKTCKEQPFKLIHTFQDEKNTVECLSHYKNHFLLSGSRDKMIRLRKIQSNSDQEQLTCSTLLARLEGHTSWIQSVYGGGSEELTFVDSCIFSSQRSTSVKESEIYMWNLEKQIIVQKLSGHECTVYKMASSPHLNSTLLSASQDSTIKMWDVRASGDQMLAGDLKGHTDWVKDIATRGDYDVISCSLDGTLRLWDVRNTSTCVKFLFDLNERSLKDEKYGFTSMSLSKDKVYLGSNHAKHLYTYDLKQSQMKCCEIAQENAIDGVCVAAIF